MDVATHIGRACWKDADCGHGAALQLGALRHPSVLVTYLLPDIIAYLLPDIIAHNQDGHLLGQQAI
jgi:hypothetical protein